MIKVNELRIGNWVELKNAGYVKVESHNIGDIVNDPSIFTPIPLTPEILEKAGFLKSNNQPLETIVEDWCLVLPVKGENKNSISFMYAKPGNTVLSFGNALVNDQWASNNFQYLHQLQNLYFALTGEELQISSYCSINKYGNLRCPSLVIRS